MKCPCKRKPTLLICKFCQQWFCAHCILPETHQCPQHASMVALQKDSLAKVLLEQKVVASKVDKI
jgi:predicted nucleic acid binding AN1-type Zn finger protein